MTVVIVSLRIKLVGRPQSQISGMKHGHQALAMPWPQGHRELKAIIAAIKGQKGRN
jgi:hypothetical protein